MSYSFGVVRFDSRLIFSRRAVLKIDPNSSSLCLVGSVSVSVSLSVSLSLSPPLPPLSLPLPLSSSNWHQGMWMATREQLRKLSEKKSCDYLNFDKSSAKGHVETHSGSLQMFRPNCGLQKVGRPLVVSCWCWDAFGTESRQFRRMNTNGTLVRISPYQVLLAT